MKAIAGHDIDFSAQQIGQSLLDLYQLQKAEFFFFIIEKKINIGIRSCLIARYGTEKIKMLYAKLTDFSFVSFKYRERFRSSRVYGMHHTVMIAQGILIAEHCL